MLQFFIHTWMVNIRSIDQQIRQTDSIAKVVGYSVLI